MLINQVLENINNFSYSELVEILNKVATKLNVILPPLDAEIFEVTKCAHCKSTNFKKNGKKNKAQRYLCKDCKNTFGQTTKTIYAYSKKFLQNRVKMILCILDKKTLQQTARICGISLKSSFN